MSEFTKHYTEKINDYAENIKLDQRCDLCQTHDEQKCCMHETHNDHRKKEAVMYQEVHYFIEKISFFHVQETSHSVRVRIFDRSSCVRSVLQI